jgi:L-rhamnonate dehydratase
VPYAIALAKGVEPYKIKWIEEFLPPDDLDGYAQVKKGKGIRINKYSFSIHQLVSFLFLKQKNIFLGSRRSVVPADHRRARVHALRLPRAHRKVSFVISFFFFLFSHSISCLGSRKCVDILQPDITWVGGLTEAKKIYSMAAAYDIPGTPTHQPSPRVLLAHHFLST